MYNKAVTSVRTSGRITCEFPITIELHQGSALSTYLFSLVMDELIKSIQEEVSSCMLFANDIILVDETISGVNAKLEIWWDAPESKGFWLSRTKIEYMKCKFSKNRNLNKGTVRLDG